MAEAEVPQRYLDPILLFFSTKGYACYSSSNSLCMSWSCVIGGHEGPVDLVEGRPLLYVPYHQGASWEHRENVQSYGFRVQFLKSQPFTFVVVKCPNLSKAGLGQARPQTRIIGFMFIYI